MSKIRVPARRGLTYMDSNLGCLVEEGPDVGDYKSRLRELDSDLKAYYDTVDLVWVVTWWNDKRGQEEYVLEDQNLGRAFERVQRSRNDRPGALTGDQLDDKLSAEQAREKEADMQKFRDVAGDAAERLTHAFKKDGLHDHEDIYGPAPKPGLSRRANNLRTFRDEPR